MTDLLIRPMTDADLPFVKSTWLRHFKDHSDFARPIRKSVYFESHGKRVNFILANSAVRALIACHPSAQEVVMGFLVVETCTASPVIQYAYVIEQARGIGVLRQMLGDAGLSLAEPLIYTHRTHQAARIADEHPELTYNPYLL